ncbi:MAG: DUF1501 domain-containing protein [Rhodospirillales bacterium]
MNRRDFLLSSLSAAALTGASAGIGLRPSVARAAPGFSFGRTVVNVMLVGGADLRCLFVPHPSRSRPYAEAFWEARRDLYQLGGSNASRYPSYAVVWSDLYRPVERDGVAFGILESAGWLAQRFAAGEVAIVANVLIGKTRRHDLGRLIAHAGDPGTPPYVSSRDGWGGRFTEALGDAKTLVVTDTVSVFGLGTDPQNRTGRLIHAPDTRSLSLPAAVPRKPTTEQNAFARALAAYYAQKSRELADQPDDWPYRRFVEHDQSLRRLSEAIERRYAEAAPTQPRALLDLYAPGTRIPLADRGFGRQCASIYDGVLAGDLFRMRVGSMSIDGWDTHGAQMEIFPTLVEDVFGAGRGLATLTAELAAIGCDDDVVFVFNSDFGRQLAANGDGGTDHGRGTYMIVVGRGVRGGVYGEMFPEAEIAGGPGSRLYDAPGADIVALTSFERVLAAVCDWAKPGSGARVFPGARTSDREPGSDVGNLMRG